MVIIADSRGIGNGQTEQTERSAPLETKQYLSLNLRIPAPSGTTWARHLLPTPGNVLFTLLVIGSLLWAQSAGAFPQSLISGNQSPSTGTIAYQGRLADADGDPLTGAYPMLFRLYSAASGGPPLWEEQWTGPNGSR